MKVISKVERIVITLESPVRMFECGVEDALSRACVVFGIDEDGYSGVVDEWERSCCDVKVSFDSLTFSASMGGGSYTMVFNTWCEKNEGD